MATTTADEFMDATLDVWELAPESATRVGHPAPFPVELPQRLIDLYTYEGDVVLDPFMGSGTTAIAAVRAGRRYLGYDTDEAYVKAARERADAEVARVQANPGPARPDKAPPPPATRSPRQGSRSPIRRPPSAVGSPVASASTGSPPTRPVREWLVIVAGASTVMRTGFRRSDVLFRTLGEAAVLTTGGPPGAGAHHRPPGPRARRRWRRSPPPVGSRSSTRWSWAPPASPRGWRPTRRAASTIPSASSCPGSDPPVAACRPPRPRSPRSSPARPSPARPPSSRVSPSARSRTWRPAVWERLAAAHDAGQHRQEFAAAWANGQAFLTAEQGLRGQAAVARRVEGTHPGTRRRGGARRPPRRPRVADQLQVPVEGARQRGAVAALRARPGRAARPPGPPATGTPRSRPTRTRRCSRSSARELGTRASLPPHAADLTPGASSRAPRLPRRGLVTRRAGGLPHACGRRRQGVGGSVAPHPRQAHARPRPCCGGCSASAARRTSCSAPSATARSACG